MSTTFSQALPSSLTQLCLAYDTNLDHGESDADEDDDEKVEEDIAEMEGTPCLILEVLAHLTGECS